MYSLIIVIGMLSPATGAVVPVGVTSQTVAKFKTLDQCKAAGNQPSVSGIISDLSRRAASIGIASMRASDECK